MQGIIKLEKLDGLYRIHERCVSESESACVRGCSICCTRNVTLTSLEAAYLLSNLEDDEKEAVTGRIREQSDRKRLIPLVTVNAMARRCMNGEDLPEEACDPAWTPCPLLDSDGSCSVYAFRPFACRAMVSRRTCGVSGEADMDDYLFTLNNVFMQIIEHMDPGGAFANLMDMVLHLEDDERLDHYNKHGVHPEPPQAFPMNEAASILMIPPEHRDRIRPVMEALQEL